MTNSSGFPDGFLRTAEAAAFLGLSGRTLEKHRSYGTGPRYLKLGGRVVYKVEDLRAWAERGLRASTSDPGIGKVLCARPYDPKEIEQANAVHMEHRIGQRASQAYISQSGDRRR